MATNDDSARAGDAARYHLFTAEHELRKARATGSAQAAAIAQLHALQLGAVLADAGGPSGGGRGGADNTHHNHQTRQTHHYLATAPLRAEAEGLELAAQVQHEAATGRALVALVAAAAAQADGGSGGVGDGGGATNAAATTTTRGRAELARALLAAVDFGGAAAATATAPEEEDDDDTDDDEGDLRAAVARGARAWELSARLEAATAAWEAAQLERRAHERRRRRQQQQQQQQQAGRSGPPPHSYPQAPPQHHPNNNRGPPTTTAAANAANAPGATHHHHPQQQPQHNHELAARWGGTTDAPCAKRARQDADDPVVDLGGTSSDDPDGGDDDEWRPGGGTRGRGGGGGGGGQRQQQQQAGRGGGALPGPFATAAAAAAAAAAGGGGGNFAPPNGGGGAFAGQQQPQQQQQPQPPPPAGPFQTARLQLVSDLRRKGQHQQAAALQQTNQAPRPAGLTARRGGNGNGGNGNGGNGNGAQGFVPPFVSKALDSVCNGNGNGGGGGGGGGNGNNRQQQQGNNSEQQEGPLSARTLELLRVSAAADLPPDLARHEPRLLELVCSEVVDPPGAAGVAWDDIAGLATVKALVKEIVVWPMLNPSIFRGARAPPRGLLLFGPPGTGKTLIGRAIASQTGAAFFSISASSLTSKWIGEGEKLVRALFAVAAHLQPSVIFVDEVDSLLSARKAEGEHEASRRLKTELLVQMEGCDPSSSAKRARVLLVGATNRPEELDEAARRRMPKQLYIPLPCAEARRQMLIRQLGGGGGGGGEGGGEGGGGGGAGDVASALDESDLARIVERTEGYSGSDMRALIQEACQGPVRDAVAAHGERVAELSAADLRPVVRRDFAAAARAARASVSREEVARYEDYDARHGAKYVARRDGGLAGGGGEGGEGGEGGAGAEEGEDDW